MLLERHDRRRHGELGTRLEPPAQLPTLDRDRARVHLATRGRAAPLARDAATALLRGGGLPGGGRDEACDRGSP